MWAILLTVMALGVFWSGIEFAHLAATDQAFDISHALPRFARYLLWQLVLFALLVIPIALVARVRALTPAAIVWVALALATLVLLGPAVSLGVYRKTHSPPLALASVAGTAASIAILLFLLAGAGRALPRRLRRVWPLAATVGWSLFLVITLRNAGAALGVGRFEADLLHALLDPGTLLLSFLAALLVLVLGSLRRGAPTSSLLIALLTLCASPQARGASSRAEEASRRPDVILIVLDALRADQVGATPGSRSLTPVLDAIAAESLRFTRAYSGGNRTFHAMPAMMTSLSAAVTGHSLSPDATTLAELLEREGYSTHGISANPLVSSFFGYDQGFDSLHDPAGAPDYLITNLLKIAGKIAAGPSYQLGLISADLYYPQITELCDRAIGLLGRSPGSTFLFMQTMDMHGPYLPPKDFLPDDYDSRYFISYFDFLNLSAKGVLRSERFRPYLENLRQRYAAELAFTDFELGRLVDYLRASGRWDEAMVWIVSDHGEAFGEHDHAGHGSHLIASLVHVPLIFKPPRALGLAPRVVDTSVSTYDIVPTTLSALGASVPAGLFGVPLVSPGGELSVPLDRPVIADGSSGGEKRRFTSIEGDWKLDITLPREEGAAALERRLFDLEADPEETEDLLARHLDIARRLEAAVRDRVRSERRISLESQEAEIDPLVRERLRNLGYVD